MIDLCVDSAGFAHNLEDAKKRKAIIPTIAEMQNPDLIPRKIKDRMREVSLRMHHPLNLFRMSWYGEQGENGLYRTVPCHVEIPPEVSGVPCRIIAMTGGSFPTGSYRVGSQFGALVSRVVTGQLPVEKLTSCGDQSAAMGGAMWHYNVTGFALAELFEAVKGPGDRLAGVCLALEGGLTAAGDLLKDRHPRSRIAVWNPARPPKEIPWNCNVKNLDMTIEAEDGLTACAKMAKYYELDGRDVILTVLPDGGVPAPLPETGIDGVTELTYVEKKRLHGLKRCEDPAALDALWYDPERTWETVYGMAGEVDRMINEFNDAAGISGI